MIGKTKLISLDTKPSQGNKKGTQHEDKLLHIDQRLVLAKERIHQLKKRHEKLQSQQALLFLKETQKILPDDFSPEMVLTMIKDTWTKAPKEKKKEWQNPSGPFRPFASSEAQKKTSSSESAHHESREEKI